LVATTCSWPFRVGVWRCVWLQAGNLSAKRAETPPALASLPSIADFSGPISDSLAQRRKSLQSPTSQSHLPCRSRSFGRASYSRSRSHSRSRSTSRISYSRSRSRSSSRSRSRSGSRSRSRSSYRSRSRSTSSTSASVTPERVLPCFPTDLLSNSRFSGWQEDNAGMVVSPAHQELGKEAVLFLFL